jgi:XTP/dITP diphosphohydrolase
MKFDKLILATNNEHKIREMSQVLDGSGVKILTKSDFNGFPDVEETGRTLAENALLKSRAIFKKYGVPAVADDTGLEVEYLAGAPGVLSARYAGPGCSFADNNRKLLGEMRDASGEERRARFVTIIAVSWEEGDEVLEGSVEGYIAEENRGSNGFGYDPVFYYPPAEMTFAEMTAEEKNRVSHRGRAVERFKHWLMEN